MESKTSWVKGELFQKVFMPVWDKVLAKVTEKIISVLFYNAATTVATGMLAVSAVAGVSVAVADTIREAPVVEVQSAIKPNQQTFDPNLTNQRLLSITITNVDIGSDSVVNAFEWDGQGGSVHKIENLTIVGLEAPSFVISGSIGTIILLNGEVDGADYGVNVDVGLSKFVFGSERGAGEGFTLDTISVDRIAPLVGGAGDSEIKNVIITDLASSSPISWDNVNIGTLTITDFKIGDGTGIDSPSFSFVGTVGTPMSITSVPEVAINVGGN